MVEDGKTDVPLLWVADLLSFNTEKDFLLLMHRKRGMQSERTVRIVFPGFFPTNKVKDFTAFKLC